MYSISFPDIFNGSTTKLYSDKQAVTSNLILLLGSDKTELFGDPFWGVSLKQFIYEQNSTIIKDLIIDEIYNAIQEFMPEIYVPRNNISIYSEGTEIWATIVATMRSTNTSDMYDIKLMNVEDL